MSRKADLKQSPTQRFPWRLVLRTIAILVVIASIVWLIVQPGFEPLIGFLSAFGALVASLVGEERGMDRTTSLIVPDASPQSLEEPSVPKPRIVNLRPLDVTHTFKDREREINALLKYLSEDGVRLISIVGRGGMGKTALACRVLADLERGALPVAGKDRELTIDGILYLSARSTGLSLDRIYMDVGRMVGEPTAGRLKARWESPDTPLVAKAEYLLEALQDGLYLILLDNLEDCLTEDSLIAEEGLRLFVECCLVQPTRVRLIVTSREQVNVVGAGLHNVRCIPLLEGLPEEESVALLRALDPQSMIGLHDAAETELHRAAQSTSGIPRALEMVAGILHGDRTATLKGLLDNKALFGERVVERLVAEGYQRLRENERRVMEALAVFDKPVSEEAVAYLLVPWFPRLNVRSSLRDLVSGHFVKITRATREYGLHPLDREYVYRQISDDRQKDAYGRRNLELRAADLYVSIRKPESAWKSMDDLAPQLAEFEHRIRADDYDGACQVLEPIDYGYLYFWGHCDRLAELRERLLGHLTGSLQANNLGSLGRCYRVHGQFTQAVECYELALAVARETGDRRGEGIWLGSLGLVYGNLDQVEEAIEFLKETLLIVRETGERQYELICLGTLGAIYRSLCKLDKAIELSEEALIIAQEINDRPQEGIRLGSLGVTYRTLGKFEQATVLCESALMIAQETGDRRREVIWLNRLGNMYYALAQFKDAVRFYENALSIAREIGYRLGQSYQWLGLGQAFLALGKYAEARRYCKYVISADIPRTSCQASLVLAIAHLREHHLTAAGASFVDASARCQAMLNKTVGLYEPRYTLATALVGRAICNEHWVEKKARIELIDPALVEYRRALKHCSAKGVVQDAIRDLELIRAAGIEGLEPVFELLESAIEDNAD